MPKFVIERAIPGIGSLSQDDVCRAAQQSNDAMATLAPGAQWQQSYVTGDKVDCVFIADDETTVVEHAALSGFPSHRTSRVTTVLDPTTGGS